MPTAAERTPGSFSLRTTSPLGAVVPAPRRVEPFPRRASPWAGVPFERVMRPRSSTSSSFTCTMSPFLTTSSVFSVRPCCSSLM